MQHPAVKSERLDPALLPPSYHQQQHQLQLQHQQRPIAPQTQTLQTSSVISTAVQAKKTVVEADGDIESQPDFQSIKGAFGWTAIDDIHIPFILRGDKQFVSVRIVEMKLLSRYPNSYPDDLGKHAPLTSFFVTANEAKLLNEINVKHCDCEYGKKEFTPKELIVLLTDFIKFYELVKKTFPDAASVTSAQLATEGAGWLQIKNTVTPYVKRADGFKYVPLSVIQYAAGLLTNEKINGVAPTPTECQALNEACKKAGVEFEFSDSTTKLINLSLMLKAVPVEIIELPSSNPLKHATYMELPTSSGVNLADKSKFNMSQHSGGISKETALGQPYLFQPNTMDVLRAQQQQGNRHKIDATGAKHQTQMPPRAPFPVNSMFDPRMTSDPRFSEFYRMQFLSQNRHPLSNGPPNVSINQSDSQSAAMLNQQFPLNAVMQYYMNMNRPLVPDHQRTNSAAQPNTNVTGVDVNNRRSPGTSLNPSPRSRPPSLSRPPSGPSGSRPPSGSPLSPTGSLPSPHGQPPSYTAALESLKRARVQTQVNGQLPLHHLENMQRLLHNSASVGQKQGDSTTGLRIQNGNVISHDPSLMQPLQKSRPNANQEIPGLFSPTGSNIPPQHSSKTVPSNPKSTPSAPPPLLLMPNSSTSDVVSPDILPSNSKELNGQMECSNGSVFPGPSEQDIAEQPRPQTLSATALTSRPSMANCIKGAWLNNKSISCLYLSQGDRRGRFCLVEAVCKLYFNGCSVNEFLFALENVLSVPLWICNDAEEKAFIQYYSLPVSELKCNKMIKFEDLEKYFPQLTYMFPSKETIVHSENDIGSTVCEDVNPVSSNGGLTVEEIEASMPAAVSEMQPKRLLSNSSEPENGPQPKVLRSERRK